MATSGVMADFTRLPTSNKVMLFVLVGAVLGIAYWQLIYKSLAQSVSDAETDHDTKNAMNNKLAADLPKYEALKAQAAELQRKINANSKALPTETELPAFFETINRKLLDSGVELVRTLQQPQENVEGFVKVPISIEVQGSFLQIKRFFASLQQHDLGPKDDAQPTDDRERIISIENLSLTDPKVNNGVVILDAKFIASTFRLADAPAGSGSAAGAGSAAKPATPPAAGAPMPTGAPLPTSTPAGAKASVEKSLEKGDARDRNATNVDEAKTPAKGGR
jgi:Tfp pilus assembly protein PilO